MNKKKIFNDPIYGLIRFPFDDLYAVIDHPFFQRLRRISQQALSHNVYPGAMHTRFQHALGATHLMTRALDTLKSKGIKISDEECFATCVAILLHDVGHSPFSHSLEHVVTHLHHEKISELLIKKIGEDLDLNFQMALDIFTGAYKRPFFHQLVSGPIDVDRMDYLTRDSFFSGVAEGVIGYDRIILMMNVINDTLVIEEKGQYSIEKFLQARRFMYWQVYLHKTVISSEILLLHILKRAKYLYQNGIGLPISDALSYFFKNEGLTIPYQNFIKNFTKLDDHDIMWMIKQCSECSDKTMALLCSKMLSRKLFKVLPYSDENLVKGISMTKAYLTQNEIDEVDLCYFHGVRNEKVTLYDHEKPILMLKKDGQLMDFYHYLKGETINEETKGFVFFAQ